MSDIIRQLPDSVANQIAAGEVVQRPSSVVKELVENAVDAGATDIQLVIKDAGRTLIQVIDNGRGMSPTDARMAFERHATSKIQSASDLFALHTMGFRGEALPSICAVAQVELRTMADGQNLGTRLLISGSRVEEQEPCVTLRGSNFMVKNLFFNTPARRKFLRSDAVEMGHIMREFERLALVNPGLRYRLSAGTREIDLRPGSFKQRIADLWRSGLDKQLLPIEVETQVVRISGFVGHPQHARRRGALQFLIVNGRNMHHPLFRKTILNCYEGIIARDTQPNFFLRFEVDPASIDVNIHPTKNEIKFAEEGNIRSILEAAVRGALGKFAHGPSIDFTQDALAIDPARDGSFVQAPPTDIDPSYNPFVSGPQAYNPLFSAPRQASAGMSVRPEQDFSRQSVRNWESLYTSFMSDGAELDSRVISADEAAQTPLPGTETSSFPQAEQAFQVGLKYIVAPAAGGLCIIDQHRAHVKILYEQYIQELKRSAQPFATQKLAFPEQISLTPQRSVLLEAVSEEITRMGFIIAREHDTLWRIEGVPASLSGQSAAELLGKIIDSLADDSSRDNVIKKEGEEASEPLADAEDLLQPVALLMARAAAIRRGQSLQPGEIRDLLSRLFSLPEPNFTPAGNAVIRVLEPGRLDALFR